MVGLLWLNDSRHRRVRWCYVGGDWGWAVPRGWESCLASLILCEHVKFTQHRHNWSPSVFFYQPSVKMSVQGQSFVLELLVVVVVPRGVVVEPRGVVVKTRGVVVEPHGVVVKTRGVVVEPHGVLVEPRGVFKTCDVDIFKLLRS